MFLLNFLRFLSFRVLVYEERARSTIPCGCGSKPMVPFWGRCTTHFTLFQWGLGCSLEVRGLDSWPGASKPRYLGVPEACFGSGRCVPRGCPAVGPWAVARAAAWPKWAVSLMSSGLRAELEMARFFGEPFFWGACGKLVARPCECWLAFTPRCQVFQALTCVDT